MISEEAQRVFEKQRAHRWRIAQTSASERIAKLRKLREAIFARREEIHGAIFEDFGKNPGETDITEVFPVVSEINDAIKHLPKWMKPHRVKTPFVLFGTKSEIRYEPKGIVLILSPWNYPFQLSMVPVIAAIAAGNCVILKPSAKVPHTSRFLKKLISDLFPEEEAAVIEGGHDVADQLLEFSFDHIFFTGSPGVGKKVMAAAAKHLTPVTLELGGKSPAIVDETADIKKAAQRILWGKFVNAGQTCVAPDYLLIHESNAVQFVDEAKKVLTSRYGATDKAQEESPSYCRLITLDHLKGLKKILDESVQKGAKIELGGTARNGDRFFPPTLLSQVTADSPIMKEEIFGPILPILTFRSIDEAIRLIQSKEKPLALYLFSRKTQVAEKILKETTSGGTCVNTSVIHVGNPELPFGGVGNSGMGNYHGFFGFKTFSHERAVLRQGALIDPLKLFYPPYTPRVKKMIAWVIKHLA